MTIELLQSLLMWCTIINFGILIVWSLFMSLGRRFLSFTQAKMFGVPEDKLAVILYKCLAYYKILVIVFNVVPFIALLIVK